MRHLTSALLLAGSCLSATHAHAEDPTRTIYHGVTILDVESESATPDSYIVVVDGKIAEIGQGLPAETSGARLHDSSGQFALPGLIDMHAHITWGPVGVEMREGAPTMVIHDRPDITAYRARMLLSYGVTTIRNPAGDMAQNRAYSDMVASGALEGPEAFHAAEVINRLDVATDGPMVDVGKDGTMAEIVARQAGEGADFIKLYEQLPEKDVAEGIAAAHSHGLPAIAHLSDVSWTRAAELGVDSLLHLMPISPDLLPEDRREAYLASRRPGSFAFFEWYEQADFDSPEMQQMLATLAQRQVHVDPTLIAFQPAFYGDTAETAERDIAFAHPDMATNWRTLFRFDLGWQPADYTRAQAVWPRVLELAKRIYEAGIPMTIGTDLANPFVAPGISVSREMELFAEAGIPSWAVLRMATVEGAKQLGIDNRTGRIAAGYEADILFTRSNPLEDFANLADVSLVLSDGVAHDPQGLRDRALEAPQFAGSASTE
jgi:imidazolonepropionase-like amidohydrolase